jgi:hypothetical protein
VTAVVVGDRAPSKGLLMPGVPLGPGRRETADAGVAVQAEAEGDVCEQVNKDASEKRERRHGSQAVDGRFVLIDWDSAALAPPERDLSLIAPTDAKASTTTSRPPVVRSTSESSPSIDCAGLDDLASAVRLFRNRDSDTPKTRRWPDGLAPHLEQLPTRLDHLDLTEGMG